MAPQPALPERVHGVVDHGGVATQEDVRLLRRELETRSRLEPAISDRGGDTAREHARRRRLTREETDVGDPTRMCGAQPLELRRIRELGGLPHPAPDDDSPEPATDLARSEPGYFRREPRPGRDHPEIAGRRDPAQREEPLWLRIDEERRADLEAEEGGGQRALGELREQELERRARCGRDRIGAANDVAAELQA